jgi:hypothetical protein
MKFSKKIKKNATEQPESQKWLWLQLGVGVVMTIAVAALYILDARENQAASKPQSEHPGHQGAGPNQASITSAAPSPEPGSIGYPCTCGGEVSPRVRLDQAKIVFSGVVLEVNDEAVKLGAEKTYKGNVEKEVVLTQSNPKNTCDILFSKGGKYLVYADEVRLDDKVMFMTDVCAGTARYANAKEDIEYLESPARFPELRKLDPPKSIKARQRAEPESGKP